MLYLWFAIDHGRRRILHFNVGENPTSRWANEQLRETFPDEPTHRYLIYDNGAIFSSAVTSAIKSFEIDPKRTAFRSPWRNGKAERVGGLHHRYHCCEATQRIAATIALSSTVVADEF